jgi:hypothetical protein
MEIVTKELDMGDRCGRDKDIRKVAREENECNVSNIITVLQSWKVTDF